MTFSTFGAAAALHGRHTSVGRGHLRVLPPTPPLLRFPLCADGSPGWSSGYRRDLAKLTAAAALV